MSSRQERPFLRSRAVLLTALAGAGVVAVAARAPEAGAVRVSAQQDTAVVVMQDSAAMASPAQDTVGMKMVADSATVVMMEATATAVAAAPAPAAPTTWPVDPVTGQTLINGIPVVGRVFIQTKVDGLEKIENVAAALAPEAMAPEPATVQTTFTTPAPQHVRRMRGIMIQSTLWMMDGKRSAVRLRHYGPSTSGASLGQR